MFAKKSFGKKYELKLALRDTEVFVKKREFHWVSRLLHSIWLRSGY